MKFDDPEKVLKDADARGLRRVLIVTALPLEMKAVRLHLKHLASCAGRDGNIFEIGQFSGSGNEWLAVVAESGAGNHASQGIVTTAINEFGPFEFVMLIGVAASRKKNDAPIGSVVISNHIYLAEVGKYQGGQFSARARDFPIDTRLVGLSKKIVRDERWHERLKPPYAGLSPGDKKYPLPFPPSAVVAPIVSVESISADPNSILEQHINSTYQDATALEMEGYGVLFAAHSERVPTVVIRGISDVREDKEPESDKLYQPIAAGHGAAFGFELLDVWAQNQSPVPGQRTVTPHATLTAPPEPATAQQPKSASLIVVLSFGGSSQDFPPNKQEQIINALKAVTGNADMKITGAEDGSFHLFIRAREEDRERIDKPDVYKMLWEECDVRLTGVASESAYRAARKEREALLQASAPLLNWPRLLPDGTYIERPELTHLVSLINGSEGSTTTLLGEPGAGKTSLLAEFAQWLRAAGVPFLGIKADNLDPDVGNELDLQRTLGLGTLPSGILTRHALNGPAVLIIDQLDALAGYVDLRTGRLNALLNLVRKLGGQRNLHIVLSARTFEYEHDARLKSVRANSLRLELPPWSTVLQILQARGIKADGWPTDAQEVMRRPQALAIFLTLQNPADAPPFATYQAMLERLWQNRILARPNGGRIAQLAATIAQDMAERETLWLAAARYDQQANDLALLTAEGVLTQAQHPGSIGFSHQTVFEYALARSFAQTEGRLSSYILERNSSLFARPKLWAALTYLRAVEATTYDFEIDRLWNSPSLRLHLRHLLIEFLGQQANPTDFEAKHLERVFDSSDRRAALHAIVGSLGWFNRLKWSVVAQAMKSEQEAGIAASILSRAYTGAKEDVLKLLEVVWLPSQTWDAHTWQVLHDAQPWTDRHLNLACQIIERTPLSQFFFDHTVLTVGADEPIIAIRLIFAKLNADLDTAVQEADRRASLPVSPDTGIFRGYLDSPSYAITQMVENSDGWDSLEALAKSHPVQFLVHAWPWFKRVLDHLRRFAQTESDYQYPLAHDLDFRFGEEGSLGLNEHPLLGALRTAAESLAERDNEAFLAWVHIAETEEAEPAQRLVAHALASNPAQYAADSIAFLLADDRRLNLGSIEDYSGTTKRLLRAVSTFWRDEQIRAFVAYVQAYAPRPGKWRDASSRRSFYRAIDRLKAELLAQLPSERVPDDLQHYISAAQRRFGTGKRGATFHGPQWIGSPMSAEEMAKATDDAVINAFKSLPDKTGWDNPKTWMKGGNIQLSRAFAEFAKTDPDRAVRILSRFTPDIGTRASGYALDSMAESAEPSTILALVKNLNARGFSGEEFHGNVSRAVERLIKRAATIDEDVFEIMKVWLSQGGEATDSSAEDEDSSEEDHQIRDQSFLWGLGSSRILPHGNYPILETLTRILLQRGDHSRLLDLLMEHLERREDERVWRAMLIFFPYIKPTDAVRLTSFMNKLFAKYPALVTARETGLFLAQAHWAHPGFVRDVLIKWSKNETHFVQLAFGELAGLVALVQPKLDWPREMVREILDNGSSFARTGLAYASVNVWAETGEKDTASEILVPIIKKADHNSWRAAFDLFRVVEEITPEPAWIKVLEAIAEQIPKQPAVRATFVVERLQTLLPHCPDLVARLSKELVIQWQSELGDLRTGTIGAAPELIDIAITLHRLDDVTREKGLELFELLLEANAYTARETLDQIDNKFRVAQSQARRTLPRRVRSRRRSVRAND